MNLQNTKRIIGIDVGNLKSGLCVIDNEKIIYTSVLENDHNLYSKITNYSIHPNIIIVIEDIKPYTLQLTPQVIDTCKVIGEMVYRLKIEAGLRVEMVSRYDVKRWVFDTFSETVTPLIEKKIRAKAYPCSDIETKELFYVDVYGRKERSPSFVYVDDKIVTEAMKVYYDIKKPSAGKGFDFGLKSHGWQALAVATTYLNKTG